MPWHLTPAKNIPSILRDGLQPRIGERSLLVNEDQPRVYLFNSFADFEDGTDILESFDEDEPLALFHVAVPRCEGAWLELTEAVPADLLQIVMRDIDKDHTAERLIGAAMLDNIDDPYASVESFRKTRMEVPAHVMGDLIGDAAWEGDNSPILVYSMSWYIEKLDDGRHLLDLGSSSYVTGPDVTVEDLEQHLFDHARSEVRPEPNDNPEP